MPTLFHVTICFALATLCWSLIGLAVTGFLVPRGLAFAAAPAAGWAVHSVIGSTAFRWIEMGHWSDTALLQVLTYTALVSLHRSKHFFWPRPGFRGTWLALVTAAAILAASVVPAVFPHIRGDNVALASPIFDHSKVALVNEIARSGLPAINPMFGLAGQPAPLPYYYLWHFSAADLALSAGVTGWEAEIALTWFTAFASLALMMGLAAWIGRSTIGAILVLAIAATASVRPFLADIFGYRWANDVTGWPTGFGAWLFQTTWAPQHAQSAACTIIALLLLSNLASTGLAGATVLALLVAAGFESSSWVGGVTFLLTASLLLPWTLACAADGSRWRLIGWVLLAAVLSIALTAPFINEQITALAARDAGFPISISPAEVLGDSVPDAFRRPFDIPAFYLLYLPVELGAIYLIGMIMLARFWLAGHRGEQACVLRVMLCTVAAGFFITDMLQSTLAHNNDLAWRGALPAIMVLIAVASGGLAACWKDLPPVLRVLTIGLIIPGVIQGGYFIRSNIDIPFGPDGRAFTASIAMWKAVRQVSDRSERIASNPNFLAGMTPWPANISWALLAERRSCYAGSELAVAFIPLPKPVLSEIDRRFVRVFEGHPEPDDLRDLALFYDCGLAVVNFSDQAWAHDPFAASPFYRLVDQRDNSWRIYRRNLTGAAAANTH